jgi:hypothetical protein
MIVFCLLIEKWMLLVKSFDLFRKTKSGKIWTYKEEKEYTAPCKLEPVALDVEV